MMMRSMPPASAHLARDAGAGPAADDARDLAAFLGCRAHQGDGRIVDVEIPVAVALGHRVHRPEVDHVERAEGDDLRDSRLSGGLEPLRDRREHAARDQVAELRRRDVERADREAGLEELLHRAAARAGLVEDEHLVAELLETLARGRHRGRGHAEHRRDDDRPLLPERRHRRARHARECARGIGHHSRRHLVHAGDVDDRVHHRHVDRADVRAGVPGSDGRDHERGRAAAVPPRRACPRTEPLHDLRGTPGHRLDGVVAAARRRDVRADGRRHFLAGHVLFSRRLTDDACIDEDDVLRRARARGRRDTRTPAPSCRVFTSTTVGISSSSPSAGCGSQSGLESLPSGSVSTDTFAPPASISRHDRPRPGVGDRAVGAARPARKILGRLREPAGSRPPRSRRAGTPRSRSGRKRIVLGSGDHAGAYAAPWRSVTLCRADPSGRLQISRIAPREAARVRLIPAADAGPGSPARGPSSSPAPSAPSEDVVAVLVVLVGELRAVRRPGGLGLVARSGSERPCPEPSASIT